MVIVQMDFAKSFDKVPHNRLLIKLSHYDIRCPLLSCIKTFLTHRTQQVVVDREAFNFTPVLSGVPQGTFLAPLLFLMFINDLPESTVSKTIYFQMMLYFTHRSRIEMMVSLWTMTFDSLAIWEKKCQMTFHPHMCKVMHFTRSRKPIKIKYALSGHLLERVSQAAYLGVELDEKANLNISYKPSHCKVNKNTKLCKKECYSSIPVSAKETAYKSLVRPALDYACTLSDHCTAVLTNRVEMVQHRAAHYMCSRYHNTSSVSGMIEQLG